MTLTYDDEHLPSDGGLERDAFTLLAKRARKRFRFRYFMCGEYGSENLRPHYHALMFGHDFSDKVAHAKRGEYVTYRSSTLEQLWPFGFSEIGPVTYESAAYVAGYVMKKVTGGDPSRLERLNLETGELYRVEPEFVRMSLKPGIGSGWFKKFHGDVFPSDEVVTRGGVSKPPRYYDTQHEVLAPAAHRKVKRARLRNRNRAEESPERLQVLEVCANARLTQKRRSL